MFFTKHISILGAIGLASYADAHGVVTGIKADGVYYQGYQPFFKYQKPPPVVAGWSIPQDEQTGFVAPSAFNSPDIICHLGASPGGTYAKVQAGGSVELQWTKWPESHHGPVIDYLANCNGECTTVDKTTLKFNKLDGVGLLDDTTFPGKWASDKLIAANNSWTLTIPSTIAPGNYVLRHEIIALHSAENLDGAQMYPQCVNLKITGSGTDSLSSGTLGTALYTAKDSGILVNIYAAIKSYVVPGPPLMGSGSTGSENSSGLSSSTTGESSASTAINLISTRAPVTTAEAPGSAITASTTSFEALAVGSETTVTAEATNGASSTAAPAVPSTSSRTGCPGKTPTQTTLETPAAKQVTTFTTSTLTSSTTSPPATVEASPAESPRQPPVASAIASTIVTVPSAVLTLTPTSLSTTSAGVISPDVNEPKTSRPLPDGATLVQVLEWLQLLLYRMFRAASGSSKAIKHARDLRA